MFAIQLIDKVKTFALIWKSTGTGQQEGRSKMGIFNIFTHHSYIVCLSCFWLWLYYNAECIECRKNTLVIQIRTLQLIDSTGQEAVKLDLDLLYWNYWFGEVFIEKQLAKDFKTYFYRFFFNCFFFYIMLDPRNN